MNQLNRKMSDRVNSINTAITTKFLFLPDIRTIAPILGVTPEAMQEALTKIADNNNTYQELLTHDKVLVTEPTIIKCETKLRAFENASIPELVATFTDLSAFIQAQLDAADGVATEGVVTDA
ncbi:MAG: hypothetical protein AAF798_15715, partial [Bacteroidota bacterium]